MLTMLLIVYVVAVLASAAFLVPGVRKRLPWLAARRVALIASLLVIGYSVFAPACVYIPSVPGPTATRRLLLGADGGKAYWLEGRTSEFAFVAGPRLWLYLSPHACCDGGIEFIPPLRLKRMGDRDHHWELVRSDGRRTPNPSGADGFHLGRFQIVVAGGTVVADALDGLRVLQAGSAEWARLQTPHASSGLNTRALATTSRGFVEVLEQEETARRTRGQQREVVVRERDVTGVISREGHYVLPDWSTSPFSSGRELFVSSANGRLFLVQAAMTSAQEGLGKVFELKDENAAVELCAFSYDPYRPLGFAVSPDGRYFTNGQAVVRMDGGGVRHLKTALRYATWQGSTVIGVRTHPFVGVRLLQRFLKIREMIDGARALAPETVAHWQVGIGMEEGLREALSRAVRERLPWHGGIDDAGGSDDIVRIEVE